MFGVDKGDAHHGGHNHTHMVTTLMQHFNSMLHWLNEWERHFWKQAFSTPEDQIRVYVGNEEIYRGRAGQPPQINKLNDDRLALLLAAMQVGTREQQASQSTAASEAASAPSAASNQISVDLPETHPDDIRLMRNDELLFYKNGKTGEVEVNKAFDFFRDPDAVKAPAPDQEHWLDFESQMHHLATAYGEPLPDGGLHFSGEGYSITSNGDRIAIFQEDRGTIYAAEAGVVVSDLSMLTRDDMSKLREMYASAEQSSLTYSGSLDSIRFAQTADSLVSQHGEQLATGEKQFVKDDYEIVANDANLTVSHAQRGIIFESVNGMLVSNPAHVTANDTSKISDLLQEADQLSRQRPIPMSEADQQQIASNAYSLVQQYGSKADKLLNYEAEQYQISQTGQGKYQISDSEGNELFAFSKRGDTLKITSSQMSMQQQTDFLSVSQHLNGNSMAEMAGSIEAQAERLGDLAPKGVQKLHQSMQNRTVLDAATLVLQSELASVKNGERVFEGSAYRFSHSPEEGIKIFAKDGRGPIFQHKDGQTTSTAQPQDVQTFKRSAETLRKDMAQMQQRTQVSSRSANYSHGD